MSADFDRFLNEAIALELNVSDLYLLFYSLFTEDAPFWWTLSIEEKNHASILKNLKQVYHITNDLPADILPERIEELKAANDEINDIMNKIKANPVRKEAFENAIRIEHSAGESHFQFFINNRSFPDKFDIFKQLNLDDKNHADRILRYMQSHLV